MPVIVADLKDQLNTDEPKPFLYCPKCGAEFSAHSGDYWNLPLDYTFKHCRVNMRLMVKYTTYEEVR